jgi:ComEC/Rec2-related protein
VFDQRRTAQDDPPRPRRRAVAILAFFALGLTLGLEFDAFGLPPPLLFGVSSSLAAAGVVARGWTCRVVFALAVVVAGAGWFSLRTRAHPGDSLAGLVPQASPIPIALEGFALSDAAIDLGRPDPAGSGRGLGPSSRFRFRVTAVELENGRSARVSGVVWVRVSGVLRVRAGEALRVRGLFEPVGPAKNPGEWDPRPWAVQEGVVGRVEVESPDLIAAALGPVPVGAERAWSRVLGTVRRGSSNAFESALGPAPFSPVGTEGRALLGALLLGREERALAPVTDAYTRLGLVHVITISGFHLVVMTGAALTLVRLTGDRGRLEPFIVAALVALYLLAVPAQAPVLRAGAVVLVQLLAEATGRRYDRLTLLAWTACALLLWRPLDAFTPGFQLSFGLTAALLWIAPVAHDRWFGPAVKGGIATDPALQPWWARARARLTQAFTASFVAWAVSAPVIAHHTGNFSPFAALTGLLLVPLFVTALWIGYPLLLLAAVWPSAGSFVGGALAQLGDAAATSAAWLDGFSFMSVGLPALPLAWTVAATVTAVAATRAPRFGPGSRRAATLTLATTAALALWLAALLALAGRAPGGHPLRADAFAAGDRPALLLRSGDQAVLWGVGEGPSAARTLIRGVRAVGGWRVRTAVVSSTDPAALGALPALVPALGIADLLVPPALLALEADRPGDEAARTLARMRGLGVRVRAIDDGQTLTFGEARLRLVLNSVRVAGEVSGTGALEGVRMIVLADALTGRDAPALKAARMRGHVLIALPNAAEALAPVVGAHERWTVGEPAWRAVAFQRDGSARAVPTTAAMAELSPAQPQ